MKAMIPHRRKPNFCLEPHILLMTPKKHKPKAQDWNRLVLDNEEHTVCGLYNTGIVVS